MTDLCVFDLNRTPMNVGEEMDGNNSNPQHNGVHHESLTRNTLPADEIRRAHHPADCAPRIGPADSFVPDNLENLVLIDDEVEDA